MFCSGCGNQLSDDVQFCPKCGAKTGGASASPASVDTNKVLKQGEFRHFEKLLEAMSNKNDGKLTLFSDRVEWKGKTNFEIKSADMAEVASVNFGGDKGLQITDSVGKVYKFLRVRTVKETGLNNPALMSSALASIATELESWRSAIETTRGRL